MELLTLLSLAILVSYVGIMIKRNGIPISISETYYTLEHPKTFTTCIVLAALLVFPSAVEASRGYNYLLILFAIISMLMTGIFPMFKTYEKTIHYAGAGTLLLASQIWIAINNPAMLLLWLLLLAWLVYNFVARHEGLKATLVKSKAAFWAEITVMLQMYLSILF